MHGLSPDLGEIQAIADAARGYPQVDVALCLPTILIERGRPRGPAFAIGAQDVHEAHHGAYTGSVSAHMLADAGARLTIVGHSERREFARRAMPTSKPRPGLRSAAGST
jgi:triosephosphate isomerase